MNVYIYMYTYTYVYCNSAWAKFEEQVRSHPLLDPPLSYRDTSLMRKCPPPRTAVGP